MTDRDAVLDIIALEVSKYENPDSQPWREFTPTALAILTALQERGFVVVPAVLDTAMRNAVNASMAARLDEYETMEPFEAEDYTAMLAASPGSGKEKD